MTEEAAKGTGAGLAVLDEAVLDALGRLQGQYDTEFVARMITMFMETALVLLIRLKEGVANGDIVALHHASHALKSCSATIGAYSLAAHCERLELIAREGRVPDPASSVDAISIEYRQAEAALIARLAGLALVAADRSAQIAAPPLQPGKNSMTRKVLSAWLRVPQASSCSGEAEVIGRGFRKEANDLAARMQPAASSLDRIA